VVSLRHAISLDCPQFRTTFFSAKGTSLCQPGVKPRESSNAAKPWERRFDRTESPNGAALTAKDHTSLGPPLRGFRYVILATQGYATFVFLTSLHPGLV